MRNLILSATRKGPSKARAQNKKTCKEIVQEGLNVLNSAFNKG